MACWARCLALLLACLLARWHAVFAALFPGFPGLLDWLDRCAGWLAGLAFILGFPSSLRWPVGWAYFLLGMVADWSYWFSDLLALPASFLAGFSCWLGLLANWLGLLPVWLAGLIAGLAGCQLWLVFLGGWACWLAELGPWLAFLSVLEFWLPILLSCWTCWFPRFDGLLGSLAGSLFSWVFWLSASLVAVLLA